MFPHERSLVNRLKDEPFVLLGVNGDPDPVELKKANEKENINWRSFRNEHESYSEPISSKWNVQGWPTLYLIDAEGVIRDRWLGNPGDAVLDERIESLIKEAKRETAEEAGV